MDWWGLPDAVALAGKLFEYRLDQLTGDGQEGDDDDYGSAAAADEQLSLSLDLYQVRFHTFTRPFIIIIILLSSCSVTSTPCHPVLPGPG